MLTRKEISEIEKMITGLPPGAWPPPEIISKVLAHIHETEETIRSLEQEVYEVRRRFRKLKGEGGEW